MKSSSRQQFARIQTSDIKCAVSPGNDKEPKLIAVCRKLPGTGLVIAPDHEYVRHIADTLDGAAVRCAALHTGDPPEEQAADLQHVINQTVKVCIADESSVGALNDRSFRFLVHWCLPASPAHYLHDLCFYCSAAPGSFAVLFYEPEDRYLREEELKRTYGESLSGLRKHLDELDAMEGYVTTESCRIAYLARYAGDAPALFECGNCDNCRKAEASKILEHIDAAKAKLLVQCCMETREKFGVNLLTDVVKGTMSGRVKEYGLVRAGAFGVLKESSRAEIKTLFNELIRHGFLKRTGSTYPTLYLTQLGKNLVGSFVHPIELPKRMSIGTGESVDFALIEVVRNFRRETARQLNLPAFMVFSDTVLKQIVQNAPQTEQGLKKVKGFGGTTWELCGEALLRVIRAYNAEKSL
ncbi:RQC domain-containing protein [candidate division KSB1 bacterium]